MEVINSSISPQRAEGHSEIHSCQSVNPTPGGPHVTSDTSSATRNHNSNSNNEINEHGKRALNDPNDHNPQPPKRQRTESHHQELLYTTPEFIRAICEGGKIDESLLLRIQSKHTKYNSARPWKLFFKDDPMLYHDMNRENRTCALCDMSFAMEMCDLKCVRTTSSDFKNTITTNCVTGYIGTRYWGSLSKVTETNAYSNAPKLCPVANCAKNIWRWNLKHHMIHNHDIDEEDIAEQHIVSKFELLCVQYQMKASYIGKDDFNNLMQKHKTKTKELFKKRYEKQQQMIEKAKAKQQRKDDQKSRSQIRKSNRNRSITQRKPKTNAKRNVDATDEEPQSTNNANTNSKQEMDASGDDADEEPQNTNNATNAKQDVDDMKQDVDDTKQDVDDTPVHHHAMDKEDEDEEEDDDAALWKTKRKKTMILRDDDTSEEEEQEEEQYWDDDSDDTNDVVLA
eukprot:100512_1